MLLLAVVTAGVIAVPFAGGRLSNLGDVRLRGVPLVFGALGVQIVVVSLIPDGSPALHRILHVASYGLAAAFLYANRRTAGAWIIAAGAACNVVAIVANGGVMPASVSALRWAGQFDGASGFANSAHLTHARIAFLGDVFAVPRAWPLHNVFSVGDVLIVVGAVVAIHRICESRFAVRTPRPEVAQA